uniref:DUF1768 domain-containing protein n=1 Tax=Strongyloides papillosus TaxID=174720 RepID=A0A0N5C627_STREA
MNRNYPNTEIVGNVVVFGGRGSPLSNFYKSVFADKENRMYYSVEQYFQYRKALYFKDFVMADKIKEAKTPVEAKRLGGRVKNFDEKKWDDVKFDIMLEELTLKFQSLPFKSILEDYYIDTSTLIRRVFLENTGNMYWGGSINITTGRIQGKNYLGKLLNKLASQLFE